MSDLKFIQVNEVLGANLLNMVWVIIGLIAIYAGVKNLLDKISSIGVLSGVHT